MKRLAILLLGIVCAGVAMATPLSDPIKEARAQSLFQELRCLVCQNQSIADSNAPLAEDLRALVRERLDAGASEAEVKAFLVERYGEFILLRPALSSRTVVLWSMPALALLIGAGIAVIALRRRSGLKTIMDTPLTTGEEERLADVLHRARTDAER